MHIPEQQVLGFCHDLELALERNSEQVRNLNAFWVHLHRPTHFFISLHCPKGPESVYQYPLFKYHVRGSKKGRPRSVPVGALLTRKRASKFRQSDWWRDHRSSIKVFNKWLSRLRKERSVLVRLLRDVLRLVDLGNRSLVALFPASHNAQVFVGKEIDEIRDREAAPLLSARPAPEVD